MARPRAPPSVLLLLLVGGGLVPGGCAHVESEPPVQTPGAAGETDVVGLTRYRDALLASDLRSAYALTSSSYRRSHDFRAFAAVLSSPQARAGRAREVDAALSALARSVPEWREAPQLQAAGEVLRRFLDAADRRDFPAVYGLLSARWRSVYSVERLAADFDREPSVRERLARARAALSAGLAEGDASGAVRFVSFAQQGVWLVPEADGYRVAALEALTPERR